MGRAAKNPPITALCSPPGAQLPGGPRRALFTVCGTALSEVNGPEPPLDMEGHMEGQFCGDSWLCHKNFIIPPRILLFHFPVRQPFTKGLLVVTNGFING